RQPSGPEPLGRHLLGRLASGLRCRARRILAAAARPAPPPRAPARRAIRSGPPARRLRAGPIRRAARSTRPAGPTAPPGSHAAGSHPANDRPRKCSQAESWFVVLLRRRDGSGAWPAGRLGFVLAQQLLER